MSLANKNIILGVSGGIAAYKAVDLCSMLKKLGANVEVILTKQAEKFVSSFSLEIISQNPVIQQNQNSGSKIDHIELAKKADLVLIAPATANTIAKLACGISDENLFDTVLATTAPVVIAPAMNTKMWEHPSTQANLQTIQSFGYQIIEPDSGDLACGDHGTGRLANLEELCNQVESFLSSPKKNKIKLVITNGPTREAIDPVRFISNRSSGKMGSALVEEALARGHEVELVTTLEYQGSTNPNLKITRVDTAEEMQASLEKIFASNNNDALIMVAAIADYQAKNISESKLKKSDQDLSLELEKTPDILNRIKEIKKEDQIIVGFSVETSNALENAEQKIQNKDLDFIVVNSTEAFGSDYSSVTIVNASKNYEWLPKEQKLEDESKKEIAKEILNQISLLKDRRSKLSTIG